VLRQHTISNACCTHFCRLPSCAAAKGQEQLPLQLSKLIASWFLYHRLLQDMPLTNSWYCDVFWLGCLSNPLVHLTNHNCHILQLCVLHFLCCFHTCPAAESMGLCPWLIRAIRRKGYRLPTPIQRRTIPIILQVRRQLAAAVLCGCAGGQGLRVLEVQSSARAGSGREAMTERADAAEPGRSTVVNSSSSSCFEVAVVCSYALCPYFCRRDNGCSEAGSVLVLLKDSTLECSPSRATLHQQYQWEPQYQ
jgi:hypothetical protein